MLDCLSVIDLSASASTVDSVADDQISDLVASLYRGLSISSGEMQTTRGQLGQLHVGDLKVLARKLGVRLTNASRKADMVELLVVMVKIDAEKLLAMMNLMRASHSSHTSRVTFPKSCHLCQVRGGCSILQTTSVSSLLSLIIYTLVCRLCRLPSGFWLVEEL